MVSILLSAIAFVAGLLATIAALERPNRHRGRELHLEIERRLALALAEAEARRAEGERRAQRERARLAAAREVELAREQANLGEYEVELGERDTILAAREATLAGRAVQVEVAERAAAELVAETRSLSTAAAVTLARRVTELEQRSGQSADQVREQRVREAVSKVELETLMRLRQAEDGLNEAAPTESRRIMQVACERYDGESHLERVQNTIVFEQVRVFGALADPDGRCRAAFVEEIGCDLFFDEAQLSVTARCDDPLLREIARRVLRQLGGFTAIDPDGIRAVGCQTRAEVDREVQNAGRKAARVLDVGRLHPDILHLVGRLKFRLSYSQNQWRHSIEVGHLAGLMADELGVDVAAARRGGLLHDIGKAMTHDHEGSHAVLGAEVARRCGEDEAIANAIGSHHNDEPPRSPVAYLVTAADAMSGGRPGARRESATQYLNRIQDIQRIASRSPAVKRVDIMQAGREVRVVVAGAESGVVDASERHAGPTLSDAEIQPLAREIAHTIQSELTFAGQIRVTVIRESRSVSVAH